MKSEVLENNFTIYNDFAFLKKKNEIDGMEDFTV